MSVWMLFVYSVGAQAHAATAVPVSRRLTKQMSTKVLGSATSNEKAAERPKSVRSLIVNEMLMTEQTCAQAAAFSHRSLDAYRRGWQP